MKNGLQIKARRTLDFLVIALCLSGTTASLYLFQRDLLQTINSNTEKNAGTVTIKHNTVQRLQADRTLWDRLRNESPVYSGDLIRVAEASEATLHIGNNQIELTENTLIKIQIDKDISHIELLSGEMNLNTNMDELNTVIDVNGRQVHAGPGTKLNVTAGQEGMALQVYEGDATLTENGQHRMINEGTIIALDNQGNEQLEPAITVQYPQPNARYIKNKAEPLTINFSWNRINIESGEPLQLKIAEDRKFTRVIQELTAINASETAIDTGTWYWRLSYNNKVLSDGKITIIDTSPPVLFSPATDYVFQYQNKLPELRFRWTEVEGVSYYQLEVSETPGFENPQIKTQVWETLYINSGLEAGTWYWRVQPVFPVGYEGSVGVSEIASFRIEQNAEQNSEQKPPALKSPLPGSTVDPSANNGNVYLSWNADREVASATVQIADNQNLSDPLISRTVQDNFYVYGRNGENLNPGQYYWNVYFTNDEGNTSPPSRTQSFTVEEAVTQRPASPPDNSITDNTKSLSPAESPNLTQPPPAPEPAVQAISPSPKQPAQKPPPPSPPPPGPLLPEPANRQPLEGYRFREGELRTLKNIVFSWSPVAGANGYIFSLYQETNAGRRRIIQTDPPITKTEWTLDNFSILDRGNFIWQVEAVNIKGGGTIDRNGRIGENTFVVDIYLPGQVEAEDTGILYGR